MEFEEFFDTSTPLAGSGVFAGVVRDGKASPGAPKKAHVTVQASSDQAGTLILEASDESTWTSGQREIARVSVAVGQGAEISRHIASRFWRVRYVNGATAQTRFRLNSAQRQHQ